MQTSINSLNRNISSINAKKEPGFYGRKIAQQPADSVEITASQKKQKISLGIGLVGISTGIAGLIAFAKSRKPLNAIENTLQQFLGFLGKDIPTGKSKSQNILKMLQELNVVATKDELTGLFKKDTVNKVLTKLMQDTRKSNEPLSVIFLDMDFFKSVNEVLGHGKDGGDDFLKYIGENITKAVGEKGFAARNGGEEFVVILPKLSKEETSDLAERISKNIKEDVRIQGKKDKFLETLKSMMENAKNEGSKDSNSVLYDKWFDHVANNGFTISEGITQQSPKDSLCSDILGRADKLLNDAKLQGRNKIISDL